MTRPPAGVRGQRLLSVLVRCVLALTLALGYSVTVLERPAGAVVIEDDAEAYQQIVEAIREVARAGEVVTTSMAGPARGRPTDLAQPGPVRSGHALISLDALRIATNMPSISLVIRRSDMYVLGFYQIANSHRFFHFADVDPASVDSSVFGNVTVTNVNLQYGSLYAQMHGQDVFDQFIAGGDLRQAVTQLGFATDTYADRTAAGPYLARLILTLLEGARNREVEENIHRAFDRSQQWYAFDDEPFIHNWGAMSEAVRNGVPYTVQRGPGLPTTYYPSVLRHILAILQIPTGSNPLPMCSGAPSVQCPASLASGNRRAPRSGLPDWSEAGYRGGGTLPGHQQFTTDAACRVTPEKLAGTYGVLPGDGVDDSAGLQHAIDDIRANCSGKANFDDLSLISMPAGTIDITKQIAVDADYLVIRGQGDESANGTRIVFRPDADTRYDTLTPDGSRWDQDSMTYGSGADTGKGGWLWPGRGLFRVQTREVAPRYVDEWAAAPANRKDLFEGSVNQHWASGVKVRGAANDTAYAAREGDRVIHLDTKADMSRFPKGKHLWVGAANSRKFYEAQEATDTSRYEDLHMRQQVFRITSADTANRTVTIDKPLEFDLPVDSTSDGSAPIGATPYTSKVTPLKMVVGVGFEDFSFTQDMPGLTKAQATHNYGNLAPAEAMHGLVFKWAADSWARGVRSDMTGSHPVVTEVAKNLQFEGNHFDGAWNKGKGGNGYFRGSRVWDSLYAFNTTRNLRHFTFQWSASGNVVYGNDFDSDLNLHGGWERRNLFENNTVRVPYEHYSANCTARCGGEGGEIEAGTWYPIWWAAGPKAVKWAGSSGPQNVFHDNVLTKQLTPGGPYVDYLPYGRTTNGPQPVYQFGSDTADPGRFQHLAQNGAPIADWNGNETVDYTGADEGVNTSHTAPTTSMFLKSAD
ncbi:ribosome-inactivating family protein [Streptomyces sp. DT171]|uniref:ribosome-inactivating family protein n=1 Tax=Streptomyces sp. DT171 TaxID=3416524 RepID=UPI003CFA5EC9